MAERFPDDTVEIDGAPVQVRYRRNRQAKRLILRVDRTGGGLVVTLPPRLGLDDGRDFLAKNLDWARRSLGRLPEPVPFCDGAAIPFRGTPHRIRHRPGGRGIEVRTGELNVGGRPEHLARRLRDWLRDRAREDLAGHARDAADRLGRTAGRITVRDTVSRWGSCSRGSGNMSFSWRLILAPSWVAAYVAAHEAAHLVEPNHSDRFWALLRDLDPNTDAAETWLRDEGPNLHRYGRAGA